MFNIHYYLVLFTAKSKPEKGKISTILLINIYIDIDIYRLTGLYTHYIPNVYEAAQQYTRIMTIVSHITCPLWSDRSVKNVSLRTVYYTDCYYCVIQHLV